MRCNVYVRTIGSAKRTKVAEFAEDAHASNYAQWLSSQDEHNDYRTIVVVIREGRKFVAYSQGDKL
jgi:hypothetical protein